MAKGQQFRVGCDIGGTFTDTALYDEQNHRLAVGKILTTPDDPSVGALEGIGSVLSENKLDFGAVHHLIHGTTLIINRIIERKGAPTALLVTEGFRDFLEIGRGARYDNYEIYIEMPKPLVPRRWRRGIRERVDREGKIRIPLDEAQAESAIRELVEDGVEAIAVCFLHSFQNPAHEKRVREIIRKVAPQIQVALSVELIPEIREYERASTTVANAYTLPSMKLYLSNFESELEKTGFKGNFYMMLSHGGVTTPKTAGEFPIRVLESGPSAGAIFSSHLSRLLGIDRVMSFDMGGTTAKSCLIEDGKPSITKDFEIAHMARFKRGSGLPINLPVIEMLEIGAGGGSIAKINEMGLLSVGPKSAGAEPGPVCYGRGGTEPTVTDADLILGYLNPDYFLGGKMRLDEERAKKAIKEKLADPASLKLAEAAWGVHAVVNENMASATRILAVERGIELDDHTVVAFGGAGPIHAYGVTKKLGMKKFIVPAKAGVASAVGFLVAPLSFDFIRTYLMRLDKTDWDALNKIYKEMEREGTEYLRSAGVPEDQITIRRSADMRYALQGREIDVAVPDGDLGPEHLQTLIDEFSGAHATKYGWSFPELDVLGLNWKIVVSGPPPDFRLPKAGAGEGKAESALKGTRPAYFPESGDYIQSPVYDRDRLTAGLSFKGPVIIEETESTTVVGPGATLATDDYLNLIVTI